MKFKRDICPSCTYISARCLCAHLERISNQTGIIVLQHPSESRHPLNTVKLMRNCLEKIQIFIGETFDENHEVHNIIKSNRTALVFPQTEQLKTPKRIENEYSHLILIDGTWKKAKKIFYSNDFLQNLPRFSLQTKNESQYKIRSSTMNHSLSTLEATVLALAYNEPNLKTASLMYAFNRMIDFQIECMGRETYSRNYSRNER